MNKILCGDCRQLLHDISDNSIDLVLTDVPYNIGKSCDKWDDVLDDEKYWCFIGEVLRQLLRVLKEKAHLTFTCAQKQIWHFKPLLEDIGYTFRHLAIWHTTRRKGSYPGQWPYAWEAIMDCTKGGFKALNNASGVGYSDVYSIHNANEVAQYGDMHPCPKPLLLWEQLLSILSYENDLVLDPFVGTGTTAIACKKLNRNYIVMDVSKKYCDLTSDRLKQEYLL